MISRDGILARRMEWAGCMGAHDTLAKDILEVLGKPAAEEKKDEKKEEAKEEKKADAGGK